MNRYLWVSASLFAIAGTAALIAFVLAIPELVHAMRMVFYTSGTLGVAIMMVGVVHE